MDRLDCASDNNVDLGSMTTIAAGVKTVLGSRYVLSAHDFTVCRAGPQAETASFCGERGVPLNTGRDRLPGASSVLGCRRNCWKRARHVRHHAVELPWSATKSGRKMR